MIENMKANKETLLIIDEAQLLGRSNLEEVRLLLNFQLNDRFLMTVLLIGQPELRDKIKSIKQLDQRIAIKYHLAPFSFNDTVRYVLFRQKKAGGKDNVFSKEALRRLYEHTKGIPRSINNLCDMALLIGYSKNEKVISSKIIESIIDDSALF